MDINKRVVGWMKYDRWSNDSKFHYVNDKGDSLCGINDIFNVDENQVYSAEPMACQRCKKSRDHDKRTD